MGNKTPSTFPSYEVACSQLNVMEISHLKANFKAMSKGQDVLSLKSFTEFSNCLPYVRQFIIPRLFTAMDSKKDGVLDFEEYLSAIALFRVGTTEEKIRGLILHENRQELDAVLSSIPNLTATSVIREQYRQLLVDSTITTQKEDLSIGSVTLDEWLQDLQELSEGMVDTALGQWCTSDVKIDFSEFVAFVKVEGCVQSLLQLLPTIVDQ